MCCNYRAVNNTCCNPLQNVNHNRDAATLPVTDNEREQYSPYIGNASVLCTFCRLHLRQTVTGDQMDDYFLFIDVLNEAANIAQEQRRRNELQQHAVRQLQREFQELYDSTPANNTSTVEKSTPNGIDLLLAAAEYVERNSSNFETEDEDDEPSV